MDNERELILDQRKGSAAFSDVSVLSIFKPFAVHFVSETQTAAVMFGGTATASAAVATAALTDKYVCRYKIIKLNGKYCLFPWAVSATATMIDAVDASALSPRVLDAAAAALLLANNNNNHIIHDKENTPHKATHSNVRSPKRKAAVSASAGTTITLSVTPIKIVNNSVQKVQASGRRRTTTMSAAIDEHHHGGTSDDDDDALTPRKRRRNQTTAVNNNNVKHSACKNLNQSLGGGGDNDDSAQLNYSIEQQDALKVKIRISDRSKREASAAGRDRTPELVSVPETVASDSLDTPSRRTRRKTQTAAVAIDAPPSGRAAAQLRQDAASQSTPQRAQRTPRKSILKTAILKNAGKFYSGINHVN